MSRLHKWYGLQKYRTLASATCCTGVIECGECGSSRMCVLVEGHEGAHRASAGPDEHHFDVWAKANAPFWYDNWVNKTGEWADG